MYSFPPLKTHVHMCLCSCIHMHMLISLHACIAATFILVFLKSMWTNLSSWGRRVYALNTSTWETNLYEFEASFVYMLSYRSPKLHSETVSKKNKRSVCPWVAIAFSHHPSCISIINSAFVIYFWGSAEDLTNPETLFSCLNSGRFCLTWWQPPRPLHHFTQGASSPCFLMNSVLHY